jgi:hypothetical protein
MIKKRASCVRLDPAVYDALKQAADAEHRTVEGQIRLLIHQHLKKLGTMPKGEK